MLHGLPGPLVGRAVLHGLWRWWLLWRLWGSLCTLLLHLFGDLFELGFEFPDPIGSRRQLLREAEAVPLTHGRPNVELLNHVVDLILLLRELGPQMGGLRGFMFLWHRGASGWVGGGCLGLGLGVGFGLGVGLGFGAGSGPHGIAGIVATGFLSCGINVDGVEEFVPRDLTLVLNRHALEDLKEQRAPPAYESAQYSCGMREAGDLFEEPMLSAVLLDTRWQPEELPYSSVLPEPDQHLRPPWEDSRVGRALRLRSAPLPAIYHPVTILVQRVEERPELSLIGSVQSRAVSLFRSPRGCTPRPEGLVCEELFKIRRLALGIFLTG